MEVYQQQLGSGGLEGRLSPALVLLTLVAASHQAILGDGRRSLYTGLAVIPGAGGRGSCEVGGRSYPSETAVPRDHPCHYCICYRGQLSCYWKSCGAAPQGCTVMSFANTCNPSLFKCTIPKRSMAEPVFGARIKPLRKSRFRRASAAPPPGLALPVAEPFPVQLTEEFVARIERSASMRRSRRAVNGTSGAAVFWQPRDRSCTILGVQYNLGEVVGVASDPCMECRCAAGDLFCSPRCCFLPAPVTLNRLQLTQHEDQLLYGSRSAPPPHPLYNIRKQIMPSNNLL